ncbi:hypothetical protein HMPREF1527_00041 [Atopobium sp. oral taxon 199 str. F0494]|nr:hypothetical protein HMPREF1527_00041 [Atopobium sp. oral taxon 199 str. F0494]
MRRRGKGSFVNYQQQGHNMETAFNFTAEMTALGKHPSSKVLGLRRHSSSKGISKNLQIPDGTQVWEIRRVRLADDEPMQIVTAYIPYEDYPELTEEALESSLYTFIANTSGRMPAHAIEIYEAINLDAREAQVLGVLKGTAALRTLRTTYDSYGKPFETSIIVLRADYNRFMLKLDTNGTHFSKITA